MNNAIKALCTAATLTFLALTGCAVNFADQTANDPASLAAQGQAREEAVAALGDENIELQEGDVDGSGDFNVSEVVMVIGRPLQGCAKGDFALSITNQDTEQFLRLNFNSADVAVYSARGVKQPYPLLPPHATGYICIDQLGEQNLTAEVYSKRMNKIKRTGKQVNWSGAMTSTSYNGNVGRHTLRYDGANICSGG